MVTESGITFDLKREKFGTSGLSMFYRLKDIQKDSGESLDSLMVTLSQSIYKELVDEVIRWNDTLRNLYQVKNQVFQPR